MIFLLRYDTERASADEMAGFFEKAVAVHRSEEIPASFFCTGGAIDAREDDFGRFAREVAGDPLFDLQDHSYSHIGLGYAEGKAVEALRADYERSFASHERVLGKRPFGISICGTSGADGPRLGGFDETEKGRCELDMVASLGLRMINSHLVGVEEGKEFCSFARLGHPEIMGFPSAHSDTSWMYRKESGDPVEFVLSRIAERAGRGEHMPLMLHDWVGWNHAADKELTHVKRFAECARELGYELATHAQCYEDASLWRE